MNVNILRHIKGQITDEQYKGYQMGLIVACLHSAYDPIVGLQELTRMMLDVDVQPVDPSTIKPEPYQGESIPIDPVYLTPIVDEPEDDTPYPNLYTNHRTDRLLENTIRHQLPGAHWGAIQPNDNVEVAYNARHMNVNILSDWEAVREYLGIELPRTPMDEAFMEETFMEDEVVDDSTELTPSMLTLVDLADGTTAITPVSATDPLFDSEDPFLNDAIDKKMTEKLPGVAYEVIGESQVRISTPRGPVIVKPLAVDANWDMIKDSFEPHHTSSELIDIGDGSTSKPVAMFSDIKPFGKVVGFGEFQEDDIDIHQADETYIDEEVIEPTTLTPSMLTLKDVPTNKHHATIEEYLGAPVSAVTLAGNGMIELRVGRLSTTVSTTVPLGEIDWDTAKQELKL